ncbi:acyl transferase domain-containing protein [Suillus paluster]|uniref:acyl transferase domain-containing protein n=1 Tax=Suillus paluster TaxID=48578 RepID=UPI001B86D63B|nr:acyl transferase domain-containing protein [Suillus paluster]KAG1725077.1 acyl transferase domain-containing protein [Suillus paluster]
MVSSQEHYPVALVGISAELPSGPHGTNNLDYPSLFDFLMNEHQAYENIPTDRFNIDALKGVNIGEVAATQGAFLKDLDLFDHIEFGISSKDARMMTIGTRKLIELSFLALLDSGIDYRGKNVGAYMASVAHDAWMISGEDENEARGSLAYSPSMIANRVSYHLDLRGPSIPTDTACSSSLSAFHLAVQSIRNGECDAAVVGGYWLAYSQGGILAPDGKCKPFDASANGGEGAVVVVIKPLDKALIDNDHIYATILGTGINSSGSLAPLAVNHTKSISSSFMPQASFSEPIPLIYYTCISLGTAIGDPTEANWVGESFLKNDNEELLIGSLKGNMGHLEITAFLASLCKVCSIFQSGIIPPNVNLRNPNPAIRWEDFNLRVPLLPTSLPCQSATGRSLISLASSGIGGANGHCVVEEAPHTTNSVVPFWRSDGFHTPCLLVAGGLSPRSTTAVGESMRVIDSKSLPSIATTFGRRSRSMPWRSCAVTSPNSPPRFTEPVLTSRMPHPLVFVFAGQGPQHFEMGRELFSSCTIFQRSILEMDEIHKLVTGFSLIDQTGLFSQQARSAEALGNIWPISVTLPALTMLQIATFDALVSLGMKPTAIVGHSAGETAVLYASGAGCKAMAVELAIARGRAMSIVEGSQGAMAAVSCSPEQAREVISQIHTEQGKVDLDVACYNTPGAVTLSGSSTGIDLAVERAKAAGFFAKRLNTAVPVHSRLMDPCHDEYLRLVTDIFNRYPSRLPQIRTYSTESGMLKSDPFNAEYYWSGARGPVRFTDAIQRMIQDIGSPDFLEIGPHPALASYLVELGGKTTTVVCPLRRPKANQGEAVSFLDALGKLAVAGHCIDFNVLNGCTAADVSDLPAYPFSRKKVFLYPISPSIKKMRQSRNGPLNYPQLRINAQTHPYLAQHVIQGEPIMPAAGYIEMALEFGARQLWDVNFSFMLSLSGEQPVPVNISTEGPRWLVRSAPNPSQSSTPQYDRLHAEGYLSRDSQIPALPAVNIQAIKERCTRVGVEGFYDALEHFAQYGPDYRRILDCYRGTDNGRDEVLVQIRGAVGDLPGLEKFKIHPVILDSAIHVLVHPIFTCLTDKTFPYMLMLFFRQWTPQESLAYDVALLDEDGNHLCTMQSFEVALHGESSLYEPRRRFDLVHEPTPLDLSSCRHPTQEELPTEQSRDILTHPMGTTSLSPLLNVVAYEHGKELELQLMLSAKDATAPCAIYFTAIAGSNGNGAVGFVRSLRKEYPSWTICVVVFDSAWGDESIRQAVEAISKMPQAETELVVDASGLVRSNVSPFNFHEPWQLENSQVVHCSSPPSDCHSAVVHVQSISRSDDQIWAFVGCLDSSRRGVMGISASPVGNVIVSPLDSMVDAPVALESDTSMGPPVLVLAVAVLAVGPAYFENPCRFRGEILVTHADTQISMLIAQLYLLRGFRVTTLTQHATDSEISRLPNGHFNVVVSEYTDTATLHLLSRLSTVNGRTFPWKHPTQGLQSLLACDPWLISHAIRLGSDIIGDELKIPMCNLSEIITAKPGDPVNVKKHLFSDKKAYLLVGGTGSLGFQIAQWMYKNGAREIVLTSRSGRAGIRRRGDTASQRIMAYLESLPDLNLRIEATDALSEPDMKGLVQKLQSPLGGCMLLSVVLADGLFSGLSAENFNAPFKPKMGAFEVLYNIIDTNKLDFLISFSSVSALFGNAGQTNYAAANTMLDGRLRTMPNAFSIITPAVTDSFVATLGGAKFKHLTDWGMSSHRVLQFIDEGIRKLADGPFGFYIPDFDWDAVCVNMGNSPMYSHLLPERSTAEHEPSVSQDGNSIADIICTTLDVAREDLSPDVPLTMYGLDSLSAARLSFALNPIFPISQTQLLANVTLQNLEARLADQRLFASTEAEQRSASELQKVSEMRSLVSKYTSGFKTPKTLLPSSISSRDCIVLVTGTTGVVGAHLLECLLHAPQISRIFLLNRPKPGTQTMLERHQAIFQLQSLDPAGLETDKVVYLEGTLEQHYFGLSTDTFNDMARNVTHIVHAAWPMDFAIPLSGFDYAIHGLRKLIDFAISSPWQQPPRLIFTSTVGVLSGLSSSIAVEEALIHDPSISVGAGYIESKWVAEHVLAAAADATRLKPMIIRLGQLTGGRNGYWKTTEWIPSMIKSGLFLGALPNRSNTLNWLPVDVAAASMVEMFNSPPGVYHLTHPSPVSWTVPMREAARIMNVPLVPYTQWLASLEKQALSQTAKASQINPALRLLDFFRYTIRRKNLTNTDNFLEPELSCAKALQESPTLQSIVSSPLGPQDVAKWMAYWRSVGFILA